MWKGVKASAALAMAVLVFSVKPAHAHNDYKIYMRENTLAAKKVNNGIDSNSVDLMCEGFNDLNNAINNWETSWKYGNIPNSLRSSFDKEELRVLDVVAEQREWIQGPNGDQCRAYNKEARENKEQAKLNQLAASREYETTPEAFQQYINTYTWQSGVSVQFSNLGSCGFPGWQGFDGCNDGFVTIKSPVEHKVCYLKLVLIVPESGQLRYHTKQCTLK